MHQQRSQSHYQSAQQSSYQYPSAGPSSSSQHVPHYPPEHSRRPVIAGLLVEQRKQIDARIATATDLWNGMHRVAALDLLEQEARKYPGDVVLDRTFQEFLSVALGGTDQVVRDQALVILRRSSQPWAKALLETYQREQPTLVRRSSGSVEDGIRKYRDLQEPAAYTSSQGPPEQRVPLPDSGTRPMQEGSSRPAVATGNRTAVPSSQHAQAEGKTPVEAWSLRTIPVHQRSSVALEQDLAPATIQRRPAWAEVLSTMLLAFVAGAVVGVMSMALLGTSDVLSAGIFLGGLSAVLGVIGAGAILSVVVGNRRGFDFAEQGTPRLVLLLGAVLGGLMTLLVALLSAGAGHSVAAWMAQALPSETYAISLWMVWGMVGGLVWSGLFLCEVLRET